MTDVLANYRRLSDRIGRAGAAGGTNPKLVAVTKTHAVSHILPVLEAGHRVFGENRVQEAKTKWPDLRQKFSDLELHLIGPLQSNKAAEAVALFDVIETIDREKIAAAVAAEMKKQARDIRVLVQVNTGLEPQKAGIAPEDTLGFLDMMMTKYEVKADGLMCIPPVAEPPQKHFSLLKSLARQAGLRTLSMGMSDDFEVAIAEGATHVRVGSAIFGSRPSPA